MTITDKILNLIFPPTCGFCNAFSKDFLCDKCRLKFKTIKVSNIDDYSNKPVYFDEHFYLLKYENEVRELILKYKFDEKSYMYKTFARLVFEDKIFKETFIDKYDCFVSVPIHKNRLRARGYNQSELIARELAKMCGKDYYGNVLIKKKNIVAQSSLDKLERIKNIKDAFSISNDIEYLKGKKIIIFDDIFTTGATANECAKVLKKCGTSRIGIVSLAKD